MTAAAVSDDFGDTEWGLEAGVLVLADGGIACVDETANIDYTGEYVSRRCRKLTDAGLLQRVDASNY